MRGSGRTAMQKLSTSRIPGALCALLLFLAGTESGAQEQPPEPATPPGPSAAATEADDAGDALAEEVYTLDDVVVTGARGERAREDAVVITEVIRREEIESFGARTLSDVLSTHPGLDITREVGADAIRIQGFDPEYVLVLVNGERTVGRINGAVDLRRFRVEDIERIEIVRGASSSLYGSDAMAGVVNIITRSAQRPFEADVTLSYGTLERLDASGSVGASHGAWSTRFTGGYHRGAGYDLEPSTVATTGNAYQTFNLANRSSFRPNDAFRIDAQAEFMHRDQSGVDASSTGAIFDRQNRTETFSASIRPELRLGAGTLRLNAAYAHFHDQYLHDQRNSNALDTYEVTDDQLGEVGAQLEQSLGRHLLTVGIEGRLERLTSDRLEHGVGERTRGSLYAQDEWTISKRYLVAVPGLRLDLDSQFGHAVSPKLSLRSDPLEQLILRASYGFGFRAPDFKDLYLRFENPGVGYVVEGNPDLQPETSRGLNVSAEFLPFAWLSATVNVFRNDIEGLLSYVMISDGGAGGMIRYRNENIDSAMTRGVETSLRLEPVRGLTATLGYTFTDSRDVATGMALTGRARHRGTFNLRHVWAALGLESMVRGSVVGRRPINSADGFGEIQVLETPAYVQLDARVAKDFGRHLTVFVQAENLLDAGDPELLTLQPRSFAAGVIGRF